MADEVHPDCSKIKADKHDSDSKDSKEEEKEEIYSRQFPVAQDGAEYGIHPGAEHMGGSTIRLEGTRLLRIIPATLKAHKYPESIGSCSPFSPSPLEDLKPLPAVYQYFEAAAAAVKSSELTPTDKKIATALETESCDSFVVLRDGYDGADEKVGGGDDGAEDGKVGGGDDGAEDGKVGGETALSGARSDGSGSSIQRKKKCGVSALTYALQMEKAKQNTAQETGAGSEMKNDADAGPNISDQPLNNRPRLEDLQPIPVRVWGPDGRPVVRENTLDSEFRVDELVTPFRFEVTEHGFRAIFEVPGSSDEEEPPQPQPPEPEPNMWQRCFMWCGRQLCHRGYEPL